MKHVNTGNEMKKIQRKRLSLTTLDAVKAMKRGEREAEQEVLGPGFHSRHQIHKSKKTYTRKMKHKQNREKDV